MSNRIFNFSAGPAVLPEPVLQQAREDLWDLSNTGIGVLEHSHRGKAFSTVLLQAIADCRTLAKIPDDYDILFLTGGASTQFYMAPMNFLTPGDTADYLVTGAWSKKAVADAKRYGRVHVACTSEDRNFSYIPSEVRYSGAPKYAHFTSNNTIFGTQFQKEPTPPAGVPLICDASSDIFSRPIDVAKYGLIYAGAQKNIGPAGVTLVIIRKDLVERGSKDLPVMLQYRTHAADDSCYNTPPTFGIYLMGQVFKWILSQGGLEGLAARNEDKAGKLYAHLDRSRLFRATAAPDSRSLMNVTFVTGDETLDAEFIAFAKARGLDGLKGHRSVGGMRASIYNAFPPAGVDALIAAMREFEDQADRDGPDGRG
ncbi:MAG: 3-phosphoserine/phosphohydroxythreonine transaminase [Planctomyces sp.]|nr:3-phosphoserine/phosphohydroxythreonine transaminase [Planctomyces sp.]